MSEDLDRTILDFSQRNGRQTDGDLEPDLCGDEALDEVNEGNPYDKDLVKRVISLTPKSVQDDIEDFFVAYNSLEYCDDDLYSQNLLRDLALLEVALDFSDDRTRQFLHGLVLESQKEMFSTSNIVFAGLYNELMELGIVKPNVVLTEVDSERRIYRITEEEFTQVSELFPTIDNYLACLRERYLDVIASNFSELYHEEEGVEISDVTETTVHEMYLAAICELEYEAESTTRAYTSENKGSKKYKSEIKKCEVLIEALSKLFEKRYDNLNNGNLIINYIERLPRKK